MVQTDARLISGSAKIHIVADENSMGSFAQERVRKLALDAVRSGKRIVFWLMAAPSGFAWYDAFVSDIKNSHELADVVARSEFFQFDDYPIARNDARFPVTFRHLLEERVYSRIERLGCVRPLELDGTARDAATMMRYAEGLIERLDDPGAFVLQVKGIGMDGHWGFHGRETSIDHPPDLVTVPINRQNRIQQTLDWPQFFPTLDAVPDRAVTATVSLFRRADAIVDLVPQASKAFAVLAAYGTGSVVDDIPSSVVSAHENAFSFVTEPAATALTAYRANGRLYPADFHALDALWGTDVESRAWARSVLARLGIALD